MPAPQNPWYRRFRSPRDPVARVICLPHAGGSASFFHPLATAVGEDLDVVAVQYPGRQERLRERCLESVHELAEHVLAATSHLVDRPTVLFGHSMGATVAFELALRLEGRLPREDLRLIVSGRRAPSTHRPAGLDTDDDEALVREIRSLGGTDERLLDKDSGLDLILPAIRGDYRAVESYRPSDPATLRCPIEVLTGEADAKTTLEEARAWRSHTSSRCEVRVFSGGHFFLTQHQASIVELVSRTAREADASRASAGHTAQAAWSS